MRYSCRLQSRTGVGLGKTNQTEIRCINTCLRDYIIPPSYRHQHPKDNVFSDTYRTTSLYRSSDSSPKVGLYRGCMQGYIHVDM